MATYQISKSYFTAKNDGLLTMSIIRAVVQSESNVKINCGEHSLHGTHYTHRSLWCLLGMSRCEERMKWNKKVKRLDWILNNWFNLYDAFPTCFPLWFPSRFRDFRRNNKGKNITKTGNVNNHKHVKNGIAEKSRAINRSYTHFSIQFIIIRSGSLGGSSLIA
jgi:hypothetical protein